MYSREGVVLGVVTEMEAWPWTCCIRPGKNVNQVVREREGGGEICRKGKGGRGRGEGIGRGGDHVDISYYSNFLKIVGCQDGTISMYQLTFNTVHGLYKER